MSDERNFSLESVRATANAARDRESGFDKLWAEVTRKIEADAAVSRTSVDLFSVSLYATQLRAALRSGPNPVVFSNVQIRAMEKLKSMGFLVEIRRLPVPIEPSVFVCSVSWA